MKLGELGLTTLWAGGAVVGVVQSLTTQYFKSLSDIVLVVPFALILVVLMFRPSGLFGTTRVERV